MHDGQESELKFFFEPRDLSKIKALPLLKDAWPQANHQRLVSTYFDTPNKYLWKHGVSLRVRQNEQGLVQTLKLSHGVSPICVLMAREFDCTFRCGTASIAETPARSIGHFQ